MAAGYLPEPGKTGREGEPLGPCPQVCEHGDCQATRRMANALCVRCGKTIGYEVGFFDVREHGTDGPIHEHMAHATCEYARVSP